MTNSFPPGTASQTSRPVLLWRPDSDESRIESNLEMAATFLEVPADSVLQAIASGQAIGGWFVDWEVVDSSRAQ